MMKIKVVEVGGRNWKVREYRNIDDIENAIAFARVSGSIGSKQLLTDVDGKTIVLADVVQINSDGTERQPYTMWY